MSDRPARTRFVNVVLVSSGCLIVFVGGAVCLNAGELLWPRLFALFGAVVGWLLAVSTFTLSFHVRSRIALLTVSIIIAAYLSEIGLRVVLPVIDLRDIRDARQSARAVRAAESGVPFDSRVALEVILDLRKNGTQALPSGNFDTYLHNGSISFAIHPDYSEGEVHSPFRVGGQEVLPLGHPAGVTAIGHENETGQWSVFTTDERGFRNPPGTWDLSEVDIVGIGDSFVEGCEVQDNDSFMGVIRNEIPKTVNLGLSGGGPLTELAAVREYAAELKPKVVLWCFYEGNDLLDLQRRMNCPLLMDYLDAEFRQDLISRQSEIDKTVKVFLEYDLRRAIELDLQSDNAAGARTRMVLSALQLSRVRAALRLTGPQVNTITKPALVDLVMEPVGPRWAMEGASIPEDAFVTFRRILTLAKEEVESWGGTMYFVYFPSWNRVADPNFRDRILDKSNPTGPLRYRKRVLDIVSELEIDSIDLVPEIAKEQDPVSLFPFGLKGHFNPEGYRIVAAKVLDEIKDDL